MAGGMEAERVGRGWSRHNSGLWLQVLVLTWDSLSERPCSLLSNPVSFESERGYY